MYVIITGCGRLGALLANQLSLIGHDVVIVDRREDSFKGLSVEFSGFKITGDATELSVLRLAKIDKADCLFSTCNEDNVNLMITQVAKYIFDVPKVIARVYNPSYESILRKFNIEIISPTKLTFEAFLQTLGMATESEDRTR